MKLFKYSLDVFLEHCCAPIVFIFYGTIIIVEYNPIFLTVAHKTYVLLHIPYATFTIILLHYAVDYYTSFQNGEWFYWIVIVWTIAYYSKFHFLRSNTLKTRDISRFCKHITTNLHFSVWIVNYVCNKLNFHCLI